MTDQPTAPSVDEISNAIADYRQRIADLSTFSYDADFFWADDAAPRRIVIGFDGSRDEDKLAAVAIAAAGTDRIWMLPDEPTRVRRLCDPWNGPAPTDSEQLSIARFQQRIRHERTLARLNVRRLFIDAWARYGWEYPIARGGVIR